jgi:CDP-diacylglycerol--glycerol-3-phosphate 3-phosphatidyltransferase
MFFLFSRGLVAKVGALVTFILASFSDFLDGYIARKYNAMTDFGRFVDPVADKVLVLAAFLAFVELKLIPAWMVVLIISRELIITGVRILASTKGTVIPASTEGKHKTVSQIVAIITILGFLVLREAGSGMFSFWTPQVEYHFRWCIFFLMLITVLLTLTSGVVYLIKHKDIFVNANNH